MKVTAVASIVITAAVMCLAITAVAQDDGVISKWQDAATVDDSTTGTEDSSETKPMVHYQTGAFMKVVGDPLLGGDQKWLVTIDLSFSNYNGNHSAWGFGLHAAIDEPTGRFGPKLLWRTPLSKGGPGYFQISPGIYIKGDDMEWPSVFIEAELGYSNSIALAAVVEHLRYGDTGGDYDRTVGHLGLKLGQGPGLVVTGILLVVAASALASMDF